MNDVDSAETSPGPAVGLDLIPPERTAPALVMSLVLHVLLLTSVGLIWSTSPRGTGETDDRPVGIALVHRLPDRDRYVDAAELAAATSEATATESSSASAAAAPPADLTPPIDLAGLLKSMQSTPSPVSGSGLAGEVKLDGDAFANGRGSSPSGDAAETTTMLFGISGSGSRFVYVFDRSDSMNGFGGKPLRAAKAELIRSLRSMTDRQRFQIIFYNDKPTPFKIAGTPLQMVAGEQGYIARAESYVRGIAAYGGTEHDAALRLALRMSPDVVFFLTDARIPRLSATQLREIRTRADRVGATIHAIEFGADPVAPRESFLRELAAQNHGQYRYVDVRTLGQGSGQRRLQAPSDPEEQTSKAP